MPFPNSPVSLNPPRRFLPRESLTFALLRRRYFELDIGRSIRRGSLGGILLRSRILLVREGKVKGCGGEDRREKGRGKRGRDGIWEGPWFPVAPVMAMRRGIFES